MTDKQFKKQKKRVLKVSEKWLTPLGLKWWRRIDFEWHRGPLEGHEEATGVATVQWEYAQAWLCFNLCKVKDLSDAEVEYAVLHELCHLLVAETREWAGDGDRSCPVKMRHEERVVTTLAKAFHWVYEAGAESGKEKAGERNPSKKAPPSRDSSEWPTHARRATRRRAWGNLPRSRSGRPASRFRTSRGRPPLTCPSA